MLDLLLVRHAKSSWDEGVLDDFERPLNARGRRDAPRMADHLLHQALRPVRLLSSPALRAVTTARIFALGLAMDPRGIELDSRIYEASTGDLCSVLQARGGLESPTLLFGHNPGISRFAHWLAPDFPIQEVPTCAVVQIKLDIDNWVQLSPGCGRVSRYDIPRDLC